MITNFTCVIVEKFVGIITRFLKKKIEMKVNELIFWEIIVEELERIRFEAEV